MSGNRLARLVVAVAMLGAASPGGAQVGFAGCTANVAVEPARYLGRNAGRDNVEVAWGGPVREVVPLGNGGGALFGDNPNAVCAARQGLVVVEAMKMENEIRAPRAGIVAEIRAREGAPVESNTILVILD